MPDLIEIFRERKRTLQRRWGEVQVSCYEVTRVLKKVSKRWSNQNQ